MQGISHEVVYPQQNTKWNETGSASFRSQNELLPNSFSFFYIVMVKAFRDFFVHFHLSPRKVRLRRVAMKVGFKFYLHGSSSQNISFVSQTDIFLFPSSLFLFNSGSLNSTIYDSFHERLGFLWGYYNVLQWF